MSISLLIINELFNRYDLQLDDHQTRILQDMGIIDEHGIVYMIPYSGKGKILYGSRINLDQPIRITHDLSHENIIVNNSLTLMDEINEIAANL
ncbi:MAG: hypothetical protein EOM59_15425 [Clostridia bacterium]|nr:hypothetical protein [Clostridia bacterium]NCD09843.1 hypothetical protein [Negativicutes bacterium]